MTVKSLWIAITFTALASGCTSQELANNATRPGKYRFYSCEELTKRGYELVKREKELSEQIQKAKQGPGGEIAIALAYQSEYSTAVGDLQEIDVVGLEKKCVLRHRPMSDRAVRCAAIADRLEPICGISIIGSGPDAGSGGYVR